MHGQPHSRFRKWSEVKLSAVPFSVSGSLQYCWIFNLVRGHWPLLPPTTGRSFSNTKMITVRVLTLCFLQKCILWKSSNVFILGVIEWPPRGWWQQLKHVGGKFNRVRCRINKLVFSYNIPVGAMLACVSVFSVTHNTTQSFFDRLLSGN